MSSDGSVAHGSVEVAPGIKWSREVCPTPSTRADGLFLVINSGRDWSGRVRGVTIFFDSEAEMEEFVARRK